MRDPRDNPEAGDLLARRDVGYLVAVHFVDKGQVFGSRGRWWWPEWELCRWPLADWPQICRASEDKHGALAVVRRAGEDVMPWEAANA